MLRPMPHVTVKFSTRATAMHQTADGVVVTAETPRGIETFEGEWAIGADGGGSIVRKCAGIGFGGFNYPERFAVISRPHHPWPHGFNGNAQHLPSGRTGAGF